MDKILRAEVRAQLKHYRKVNRIYARMEAVLLGYMNARYRR